MTKELRAYMRWREKTLGGNSSFQISFAVLIFHRLCAQVTSKMTKILSAFWKFNKNIRKQSKILKNEVVKKYQEHITVRQSTCCIQSYTGSPALVFSGCKLTLMSMIGVKFVIHSAM